MVAAFHRRGLEVVLDVVFNHTAEGGDDGPTYHFRGLDNSHVLHARRARGSTSTSPAAATRSTATTRSSASLILSCLRNAVAESGVDGFRFDLASVLGRDRRGNVLVEPPVIEQITEDALLADTEADRRALGRRRALPGRQLPRRPSLVGLERPVSRRRPPVLEGRPGDDLGAGHPDLRLATTSARAAGRSTRSTSSPATTASPSPTSSPTTTSTTRPTARGTATAPTTTLSWNCGVEGPTDDPRDPRPPRPAGPQPDGHAPDLAGRADDPRRRRVAPDPAGQQQRLVPGQRDRAGSTGPWSSGTPTSSGSSAR